MKKKRLTYSEWFLLLAVLGFVAILLVAQPQRPVGNYRVSKKVLPGEVVRVHIEGAVERPGTYEVKAGTSAKEAVAAAGLMKEGRNWGFKARGKIDSERSIFVPLKKKKRGKRVFP